MFSIEGYVPVAKLWSEFEARFGAWCRTKACECYRSEDFAETEHFGSPRDLCEDLFFQSLVSFNLTLVATDGQKLEVMPDLNVSNTKLFQKATQFESLMISMSENESGPDNKWLLQMGSHQFLRVAHTDSEVAHWLEVHDRDSGEKPVDPDPIANKDHTLPYFYQRPSFVIPKELPPWTKDMIDGAYVRNLSEERAGNSICLASNLARKWREGLSEASIAQLLGQLIKSVRFEELEVGRPSGGRPRKVDRVAYAYRELQLAETSLSWKEKLARVEKHLGIKASDSTLKRAAELIDAEQMKD